MNLLTEFQIIWVNHKFCGIDSIAANPTEKVIEPFCSIICLQSMIRSAVYTKTVSSIIMKPYLLPTIRAHIVIWPSNIIHSFF